MKKAREDKKELAYGTLQFVFQSKSKCMLVFELSMPVNKMKFNVNRTKAAKEKNRRLIFRLFRLYLFTLALLFSMLLLSHRANNTHTHTQIFVLSFCWNLFSVSHLQSIFMRPFTDYTCFFLFFIIIPFSFTLVYCSTLLLCSSHVSYCVFFSLGSSRSSLLVFFLLSSFCYTHISFIVIRQIKQTACAVHCHSYCYGLLLQHH